ncbi:MAG: NAD(P)/FAD-dependent oxidoreductase [Saprospiraceae bacterium]
MKIVILGNGISGITAARHVRKNSDHEIVVVSDESDEFFSRTALMYIYMGHMRERDTRPYEPWFWEKNRIQRVRARIESVDFAQKTLHAADGSRIGYDKLLLAVGSKSNKFGWPGQDLDGVHGLYHLQDLAAMERHSAALGSGPNQRRAVITGGGLIGVEMAEMFHSRHIPVTFLVRENDFWSNILPAEESAMISRHLRENNIDLRLQTELREITDDGTGKCGAVTISTGETIACGFVGLTVGVSPNIDFLKNTPLEINRGILVNEFLETNLPDVYAVGDCVELRQPNPGRRAIEAVWYTGRMMGEAVAHTLTGNRRAYDPGVWFNSAKFFDIEYQVYGDIRPTLPDGQATLYWEHPGGKASIRLNYERTSGRITGFNLMGVRYRHEVCEHWLQQGTPITDVLRNLGAANFDPEFYQRHEHELAAIYQQQSNQ